MKWLITCMILSIVSILLGGFVCCFPQFFPFAVTLISVGGICFISFGVATLCYKCGLFD